MADPTTAERAGNEAIRLSERVSAVTNEVADVKTTLALLQDQLTNEVAVVKTTLALLQDQLSDANKQILALSPAPSTAAPSNNLIRVNVGGKVFTTRRSTFENAEGTYFEGLVSDRWEVDKDEEGNIFIDRDPKHFPG